jgi:predicted PurR-regulated permease PerM
MPPSRRGFENPAARGRLHHPIRVRIDGAAAASMLAMADTTERDETIRPEDLRGLFRVPDWLRNLGLMAWLLVGVTLLLVGIIVLLSLTGAIVMPVLTAAIIAAVLSPVVGMLQRRGVPRGAAAAILLIAAICVGTGVAVLVLSGIASQTDALRGDLQQAADKLRRAAEDAGVAADSARTAQDGASRALSEAFSTLISGLGIALGSLASLAVFLSFTTLSLFFLLKDGPLIRSWAERHMGIPRGVAHSIAGRTLQALRGYFAGVTAVALFNALVIGGGALLLGVPRAGSIAVVNFVCAYVPYLGAWSAGAFTVLIALGAKGPEIALAMVVISLLANGALQQMIQPIAFGATLDIHPLGVLVVTIAAGALFGTVGLILAAPLTSAAARVSEDLARARAGPPG